MTTDLQATWQQYTATWKMNGKAERLAAFATVLADHAVYTDPLIQTQSWDALLGYMESFHQQIPGGHFETRYFLAHHRKSIAKWEMLNVDGISVGSGISYGEYDENGKLLSINGFFENQAQ